MNHKQIVDELSAVLDRWKDGQVVDALMRKAVLSALEQAVKIGYDQGIAKMCMYEDCDRRPTVCEFHSVKPPQQQPRGEKWTAQGCVLQMNNGFAVGLANEQISKTIADAHNAAIGADRKEVK